MNSNNIWYNNPNKLLEKPLDIFPINFGNMVTPEDRINSFMRAMIVGLGGLFLMGRDIFLRGLIIVIILVIISVIYYESLSKKTQEIVVPNNNNDTNNIDMESMHGQPLRMPYPMQETLSDRILGDIKNKMKFREREYRDHKRFHHLLHLDRTKYGIQTRNQTIGGHFYGSQQPERHLRGFKEVF